jgi:hypothetical protein
MNRFVVMIVVSLSAASAVAARPLAFEANGQPGAAVRYVARGRAYTTFLGSKDAVVALADRRTVLRLTPIGADDARIVPTGRLRGPRSYRRVRYVGIYPGIDLQYRGDDGELEYDFIVAAGADPERIVLAIDGADRVEVDGDGALVAHTSAGDVRQPRPFAYQRVAGARRTVDADWMIDPDGHARLRLGAYDRSRRLVIDPVVTYGTYLGGTGDEADVYFEGDVRVARDGAGNVYVTGTTRSTDFPTTPGAYREIGGDADLFVTKLSPAGAVLWSTYLGGPCEDSAGDIAVDGAGAVYVTGQVNGGGTCPSTGGALVAKLDAAGAVVYAQRLGGSLLDSSYGTGIAVDGAGHACVTGVANTSDFPTTTGALRTAPCPNVYWFGGDGFVAMLSADGGSLVYSTLLCGQGDDVPADVAIDADGFAYVAGVTTSSDFPTVDPIEATRGGGVVGLAGFVSKLTPDGSGLVWSTYLGGSGSAAIAALALGPDRSVYVTGETSSEDFPTTPGVLQPQPGQRHCIAGCTDAFVTRIAPNGRALVYSTYLFGELDDAGNGIAVDGAGNAYVVGSTVSGYFPIVDAFQSSDRGLDDAFVAKLTPDGTRLVYSSYLGGSRAGESPSTGGDAGSSIVLDADGAAWVGVYTQSFDMPSTANAAQPQLAAGVCDVFGTACGDAFIARIGAGGPGVTPPVHLQVDATDVAPGATLNATWGGNPAPSPDDYLRLFALGTSGEGIDDPVVWWATPNAAAGALPLLVPALPDGWYELRLLSPSPESGLPVPIARSAPIRIGAAVAPPPPGHGQCDDGDPCTDDAFVAGVGCVSTAASGFAGVTCTCGADVAACAGVRLPSSVSTRRRKACALVAAAAGAERRQQSVRRLRKSMRLLGAAMRGVAKKGVPAECAGVLRDARDRVSRLLATLAKG